jgi:hypothetical protein
MSGSHRMAGDRPERRWPVIAMAGAAVGAVVCGTAVVVVLSRGAAPGPETGLTSRGMSAESSPMPVRTERQTVPDACGLVTDQIARELVPDADRTQADTFAATDAHNQCVWSKFGDTQRRQLTVELRAIRATGNRSADDAASATLRSEKTADEAGKGLPEGQRVSVKRTVDDVGEEGYLTYSVQSAQRFGEAIVNVRAVNVLITVHYGGGDGSTVPLSSKEAIDGALRAAKETISALGDR